MQSQVWALKKDSNYESWIFEQWTAHSHLKAQPLVETKRKELHTDMLAMPASNSYRQSWSAFKKGRLCLPGTRQLQSCLLLTSLPSLSIPFCCERSWEHEQTREKGICPQACHTTYRLSLSSFHSGNVFSLRAEKETWLKPCIINTLKART